MKCKGCDHQTHGESKFCSCCDALQHVTICDGNAEAETRRREKAQAPRTGYPGADQMMRYQRDYK